MDEEAPAPPAKPSQIPSWVTLGFVLGALFVLAWPRRTSDEAEARPRTDAPAPRTLAAPAPRLATIDAVFQAWGGGAVWSDGTTEVALWSPETKSYSDFSEVVKVDGEFYYRPIPALTRPILTHGILENSPLEFTETELQRQEWLGEVRKENWKAFTERNVHTPDERPDTEVPPNTGGPPVPPIPAPVVKNPDGH
jgi:hypothetical protein